MVGVRLVPSGDTSARPGAWPWSLCRRPEAGGPAAGAAQTRAPVRLGSGWEAGDEKVIRIKKERKLPRGKEVLASLEIQT